MEAALDIIGVSGISSLSIAGIADRVGIVPSAIYRHFGGKDQVLDAVIEHIGSRFLGNIALAREEAGNAPEILRCLLMRHVRMHREIRAMPHILFYGIYTGHPQRKTKLQALITSFLGSIQQVLREGIEEGSVREEVEPVTASVMFLGMIIPAAVTWNFSGGNYDLVSHAEKVWPNYHHHIATENRD